MLRFPLFVLCGVVSLATAPLLRGVEIIAHRGASHDAPENTMSAFRLAWKQQADTCELDVFLSKDQEIAVIHDKDTKRLAGLDKKVVDQTMTELRRLDVGRWKRSDFLGEKIPTLAEALSIVPPGKRVFIEVKIGPEIVPVLEKVLKNAQLAPEQTPIISFNADVIAAMKKARPDLAGYWISSIKKEAPASIVEELIAKAKSCHADGIDVSAAPIVDETFVKRVQGAGLKCYVWTVNDAVVARRMLAAGVDGITTDRPGWLREQLKLK